MILDCTLQLLQGVFSAYEFSDVLYFTVERESLGLCGEHMRCSLSLPILRNYI